MKRLLLVIGLLLTAQNTSADISQRITIDEVLSKRNIIVRHPETDDRYLLFLGSGCGDLRTGQQVSLILDGALDANKDEISIGNFDVCDITEADRFDEAVTVTYVLPSNTEAHVLDEGGQKYSILYPSSCRGIQAFLKEKIYIERTGRQLKRGDKVFLANRLGECQIRHVRTFRTTDERPLIEDNTGTDRRRPTIVKRVEAIPGNTEVTLTWRRSTDNKGISHYIVSHDKSPVDTRRLPIAAMPNRQQVTDNKVRISGLENNKQYFFYVLAVDINGNTSAQWSTQASTTPRATVLSTQQQPSGGLFLNLRLVRENSKSFWFRWNPPSDTVKQTIILEVDGEQVYASNNARQRRFRVAKRDRRKGKELKVIVRAYDIIDLKIEEEITFSF